MSERFSTGSAGALLHSRLRGRAYRDTRRSCSAAPPPPPWALPRQSLQRLRQETDKGFDEHPSGVHVQFSDLEASAGQSAPIQLRIARADVLSRGLEDRHFARVRTRVGT